ncbi:MAG: cytochrome c oxidase subunit II [Anaerolineales bacterium]|nr:cytochrome c oxidase subunit II [Anaerolineales bacterium]
MSQQPLHIHPVERAWIMIGLGMLAVFAATVFISSFGYGFQLPVPAGIVDPALVATPGATNFGEPGLKELSPGNYEARILAQAWLFTPKEITIKAGSKVTFYMTSRDIQHGIHIDGTNVNMMLLPGQISRLSATFDKPGEYIYVCHEFCGVGHQTMFGKVIVEP